jgi:hypothetical protein
MSFSTTPSLRHRATAISREREREREQENKDIQSEAMQRIDIYFKNNFQFHITNTHLSLFLSLLSTTFAGLEAALVHAIVNIARALEAKAVRLHQSAQATRARAVQRVLAITTLADCLNLRVVIHEAKASAPSQ